MTIFAWQQQAVIVCDQKGHTPSFAAEFSGLSVKQVYELRRRLGIQKKARKYFAEDIANMLEMHSGGKRWKEIAKHYGTNEKCLESVILRARKLGFEAYPKRGK